MRLLNWNIEWASKGSRRGKRIAEIMAAIEPDVICLTEATHSMIPTHGYTIKSEQDYGYPNRGDRRKVVLWSKKPWQMVDTIGSTKLPSGRFVSGITFGIRFAGICIPWFAAHVATGRRDRTRWQDHGQYLRALKPLANTYCNQENPVCIAGDFNQRIPRRRQPQNMYNLLIDTFEPAYTLATAGLKDKEGRLLIDHIAVDSKLSLRIERLIPKKLAPGLPLSDHVGVLANFS